MLKRVVIKGFRSCHDVDLKGLGALTVLVGRNAVGKSNILRAISWLASTATSSDSSRFSASMVPRAFAVLNILGQDTYEYSFEMNDRSIHPSPEAEPEITEILCHETSDGTRKEVFKREHGDVTLVDGKRIRIGSRAPCMPALVSVLPPGSEPVRLIRPLLQDFEAIRYYPLEPEAGAGFEPRAAYPVIPQSEYNEWLNRHRGTDALGTADLMRLLNMHLTRPEEFDEVQQLLGPNGLGLIDRIDVEQLGIAQPRQVGGETWYSVRFQPSLQSPTSLPQHFSLGDLSSGTQRLIAIITSLI